MKRPSVAVVGLGQIGGSLAAALTRRRLARVTGVTRRAATARRALRMGLVRSVSHRLEDAAGADVVVLATPVRTLLRQLPRLLPILRPEAVLTDVGSTKGVFLDEVRRLRPRVTVVGGHPMAGNEKAGLDGCDADLFEGRPWTLIPAPGAAPARVRMLERLIRGVGARPLRLTAKEHDLAVARISHLPYLLAYALMEQPDRARRVAGPSFRDATRVALSEPGMVLDFLITNPRAIGRAAAELERRLRRWVRMIRRGGAAALKRRMNAARSRRRALSR